MHGSDIPNSRNEKLCDLTVKNYMHEFSMQSDPQLQPSSTWHSSPAHVELVGPEGPVGPVGLGAGTGGFVGLSLGSVDGIQDGVTLGTRSMHETVRTLSMPSDSSILPDRFHCTVMVRLRLLV